MKKWLLFICLIICYASSYGQRIAGTVINVKDQPIEGASVIISNTKRGTSTDAGGKFSLMLERSDSNAYLIFRHVRYKAQYLKISETIDLANISVTLEDSIRVLNQIDVTQTPNLPIANNASTYELNPINAQTIPSPFQDLSGILITLPGVSSNNEFSSAYAVRGGNYDENLVYVNNIPVYKPQIVTTGQQEGLSFINIDMTKSIEFSSGGWESKYGDGLSSALNVNYKTPKETSGSLNIGLLGGSAYVGGADRSNRFHYLLGARLKSSEYLLNTLETEGEYRPRFIDLQGYFQFDISSKTDIGLLLSYAQNRYSVIPTSRETTFGTFNEQKRLFVAFDGQERLTYDTWQSGLKIGHSFSDRWNSYFILSATYSREREYYDIESGYLLCNVDNNPGSPGFNECLNNIGIGINYFSGRNLLDAELYNIESRNEIALDANNTIEFGLGYAYHDFEDALNEYNFEDSANYVTINESTRADNNINYSRFFAYGQHTSLIRSNHILTYGLRVLYQDLGENLLLSPRIQYSWEPVFLSNTFLRASAGVYSQAPFYREFRNSEGEINEDLKAQSSFHSIVGLDVNFNKWGRPFKFTTEVYYKYLWNVNPYDIQNVRIRYFGDNVATAYAAGIDFRISGEFLPGDESWFSLGILSTRENIEDDERGYIPRPMDRRVNLGIFFQDHIPNSPTFRVYLRLLYATGLPFSPPQNPENRNKFRGEDYQRIDVGFAKIFNLTRNGDTKFLKSIWITAEVLNLTGHQNVISYNWVNDVNNIYYAVPNALSQRFFNVRASFKF